MSAAFDPYRDWLGLEPSQQPPSHYQLLGLAEYEADADRILAAADARMAEVRKYQTGPRGTYTQKILNELSAAKLCLLNARTKQAYDEALHGQQAARLTPAPRYFVATMQMVPSPPAYIEAPPVAPPPAGSPVAPPLPPKHTVTKHVVAEDEVESQASSGWLLPLLGLTTLLVIATVAAGLFYANRSVPVVELPPTETPTPAVANLPPDRRHRDLPTTVVISQEGRGDLNFSPATAELLSGVTRQERGGATLLTDWAGDEALARWRFKLVQPAIFKIELVYQASGTNEAEFELIAGEETKLRSIIAGENGEQWITDEFFWRITRAGEQTLDLRIVKLPAGAQVVLKSLRLTKQDAGRIK